jgi:hypothetical protein
VVQPTSVTTLHSAERREVALHFQCSTRPPLTLVLPQMAAAELVRMLGAELDRLGPLPGEGLAAPGRNN